MGLCRVGRRGGSTMSIAGLGTIMRRYDVPSHGVIEGLSCVIGLFGRYGLAATLGQHCP